MKEALKKKVIASCLWLKKAIHKDSRFIAQLRLDVNSDSEIIGNALSPRLLDRQLLRVCIVVMIEIVGSLKKKKPLSNLLRVLAVEMVSQLAAARQIGTGFPAYLFDSGRSSNAVDDNLLHPRLRLEAAAVLRSSDEKKPRVKRLQDSRESKQASNLI